MTKRSQRKTTAAVLRFVIELRDSEMATLAGCSVNTIWSVESGRLKLSEALAKRMSHTTGVAMEWLLASDPKAQPVSTDGSPFTLEKFESHAAGAKYSDHADLGVFSRDFITLAARLRRILRVANDVRNYHMAKWKISRTLDVLAREFDRPPKTENGIENDPGKSGRKTHGGGRWKEQSEPLKRGKVGCRPQPDSPDVIAHLIRLDVERYMAQAGQAGAKTRVSKK